MLSILGSDYDVHSTFSTFLLLISAICESLPSIIRCLLIIRSCLLLVISYNLCWCALFKTHWKWLLLQLIYLLKFATKNDNTHSKTIIKATDHDQLKLFKNKNTLNTTSKSYKIHYIKNEVFHCSTLQIKG